MSYTRVIPRDLFNEAKLLKCFGRLALLIHDRMGPSLRLDHDTELYSGFSIDQDSSSGDLVVTNLRLYSQAGEEIFLSQTYNSKSPYPLTFITSDGDSDLVFTDDGQYSAEFLRSYS